MQLLSEEAELTEADAENLHMMSETLLGPLNVESAPVILSTIDPGTICVCRNGRGSWPPQGLKMTI